MNPFVRTNFPARRGNYLDQFFGVDCFDPDDLNTRVRFTEVGGIALIHHEREQRIRFGLAKIRIDSQDGQSASGGHESAALYRPIDIIEGGMFVPFGRGAGDNA